MSKNELLTGIERQFPDDDIIVSKTDLKGRIIYANKVFLDIADYSEAEVLDQPHSLIRHPKMPRCVFKLLWDTIEAGNEIFAYVINRTKFGDHYWVLAHVTPSLDAEGSVVGYHSSRRVPSKTTVTETIEPLYAALIAKEEEFGDRKQGLSASTEMLLGILRDKGVDYERWLFSI
jgi:PAS domain S-box-containing protein